MTQVTDSSRRVKMALSSGFIEGEAMKILIIEDSRAVAAVMAARLGSLGHEVDIAENGAIGVDKFVSGQPDLIFMDIEMPVMNGFEATNRIRAHETKAAVGVDTDHFPDRLRYR